MTSEQRIQSIRESFDRVNGDIMNGPDFPFEEVVAAVEAAVAENREACTKIVEKQLRAVVLNGGNDAASYWLTRAIAEIRGT